MDLKAFTARVVDVSRIEIILTQEDISKLLLKHEVYYPCEYDKELYTVRVILGENEEKTKND